MKIQDIAFFIILISIWFLPERNRYLIAGLLSIAGAIPLFSTWTFFTAERLTWYGAAFILVHIGLQFFESKEGIKS